MLAIEGRIWMFPGDSKSFFTLERELVASNGVSHSIWSGTDPSLLVPLPVTKFLLLLHVSGLGRLRVAGRFGRRARLPLSPAEDDPDDQRDDHEQHGNERRGQDVAVEALLVVVATRSRCLRQRRERRQITR